MRVLAMIHEAQGTPEGRRLAIADLETLIEPRARRDRRTACGWPCSWRPPANGPAPASSSMSWSCGPTAARDAETIARRPIYLAQFIEALVRHHQPGDESELAEARQLVGKLRRSRSATRWPR